MPEIIVHVPVFTGHEAIAPAFCNGKKLEYPINTPFDASDELLTVLLDSSLNVEVLPEGGSSEASADTDEGAGEDRGGAAGATSGEDEPEPEPEQVEPEAVTGEEPQETAEPEPEAVTAPEPHPLDHDHDGKPGGSLPGPKSTRARGAAKAKAAKA